MYKRRRLGERPTNPRKIEIVSLEALEEKDPIRRSPSLESPSLPTITSPHGRHHEDIPSRREAPMDK